MKNKSIFSRLLANKKLVIILSFVLALIFWIITSDNISTTIGKVPLKHNLSEKVAAEYKVFGLNIDTVSVDVKGKRVAVESLKPEDIDATVDLSKVTGPTTGTFDIIVKNHSSGYDINGVEPSSIKLIIDKEITKSVPLVSDFKVKNDGRYVENNAPATIEVTGPESIVSTVKSAYITGDVAMGDAISVTNSYKIALYNVEVSKDPSSKNLVSTEFLTLSMTDIDVTFRFLTPATLPLKIISTGASTDLTGYYQFDAPESETLNIAGPDNLIQNAVISVDIGEMSEFENKNYERAYNVSELLNSEFVNLDEIDSVIVTLNFSSLKTQSFKVPTNKVQIKNLKEGYSYVSSGDYITLKVVGTEAALENISADDFSVIYDFNNETLADGNTYMTPKVKVSIKSDYLCWAYRFEPKVNIITEAQ